MLEGVTIQKDPPWGKSNAWLSVVTFDSALYPGASEQVRNALEKENIESRPIWKPMHQQPVFSSAKTFLNGKADEVYEAGLCLPSGPSIKNSDIDEICSIIKKTLKR
jgi:dTDP-4-amino-4,6-dideoxygalactose transaminase